MKIIEFCSDAMDDAWEAIKDAEEWLWDKIKEDYSAILRFLSNHV